MERPVTFTNEGQQIVGMLHVPDGLKKRQKAPAIAMFHGFTGHKAETHRLFVRIARAICKEGFVVLRIDFRGSGDSEGDFEDMTAPAEVSDAEQSITFLSGLPEVNDKAVGVIGLSMGGRVAAILASKDSRVKFVVLYSAALAARRQRFWQGLSSEALSRLELGEAIQFNGGWYLKKPFFDTIDEVVPHAVMGNIKAPVLIVHGDADQTVPLEDATKGYAIVKGLNPKNELHIVKGGDHTYSSKEHTQEVTETTINWLKSLDLKALSRPAEEAFVPSIDYTKPWFHGSPQRLSVLRSGSTITQDEELARAFSHQPTLVSVSDKGVIKHDGKTAGFLYKITEDVFSEDIKPHPNSSMQSGKEWITAKDLQVEQIGVTFVTLKEALSEREIEKLKQKLKTSPSKP